jgi:hypothetical protein
LNTKLFSFKTKHFISTVSLKCLEINANLKSVGNMCRKGLKVCVVLDSIMKTIKGFVTKSGITAENNNNNSQQIWCHSS